MQKQSWLSKIMFFFNIVLAVLTFLAYLLPFLAPKAFPFLSVLTLILPFFLILNLLAMASFITNSQKSTTNMTINDGKNTIAKIHC